MPTDHCFRLDDLQSVQHLRGQTINPGKHQTIDIVEIHPLRRFAPKYIKLVPKQNDFGLQRGLRLEQSNRRKPNQPAKIAHWTKVSADSRPGVSHFEFAVGTGDDFSARDVAR